MAHSAVFATDFAYKFAASFGFTRIFGVQT